MPAERFAADVELNRNSRVDNYYHIRYFYDATMKLTIKELSRPMVEALFATGSMLSTSLSRREFRRGSYVFETGNLGDHKSVGGGVWEGSSYVWSGYRIYFGKPGRSVILLLLGGAKGSQTRDVREARQLWREYLEVTKHGKTQ